VIELSRTVRFCVNPGCPSPGTESTDSNGFAGRPSMRGLGRYYELQVHCRGEIDPDTGYFIPIQTVDSAVRSSAIPIISKACAQRPDAAPESLLPHLVDAVDHALEHQLVSLHWCLTPYYSIEMTTTDRTSVTIRQMFDFAAAHRLDVPSLSPDENRALFGKCNNPNYHGHNYRIEPAVRVELLGGKPGFTLQQLEAIVDRLILSTLDHRNLNLDVPGFSSDTGDNPSVENIARVCYDTLAPAIERESNASASLAHVTVWETDRTCAVYPG